MERAGLVTFASKYHNTQEIVLKIGEILRQPGFQTDLLPVHLVENLELGQWIFKIKKILHLHDSATRHGALRNTGFPKAQFSVWN